MNTTSTAPSLYDLLDVAPEASSEEIRVAWRSAIEGLEPGDRPFRAYNAAAETLLDRDRRAAYDAELADADAAERRFRDGAGAPPQPAGVRGRGSGDGAGAPPQPAGVRGRGSGDGASAPAQPAGVRGRGSGDGAGAPARPAIGWLHRWSRRAARPVSKPAEHTRRSVPGWLLIGLALITAGAVALAAWLWSQPSDAAVAASTRAAQAAAERAIVPVLSYDARSLDEDQAAGAAYLTADYRKDYDQLYEVIRQNAPRVGTAVSAEVVASGIVRSGPADPDRVDVLVFVNRPTTNRRTDEPVVYRDQVTVTMQNVDGSWLVDGLRTSPAGE